MTSFTVTAVRKELGPDGVHRHIAGVWTSDSRYWDRPTVVSSIRSGNQWSTSAGGYTAKIHVTQRCHLRAGCSAASYIATNPDSSKADNLENLPEK